MKKYLLFSIKLIIAIAIICFIIHEHKDTFVENIKKFQVIWFIPAVLMLFIQQILTGWRWGALLKIINPNIPILNAIKIHIQSVFYSLAIPGSIGGDFVKLSFIIKKPNLEKKTELALTILLDRMLGMVALFILVIPLIIYCIPVLSNIDTTIFKLPKAINNVIIFSLLIGCFLGLFVSLALFFCRKLENLKFIGFILKSLDKLTKGMISKIYSAMDLYRENWKTLTLWIFVSTFVIQMLNLPAMLFLAIGLQMTIPSILMLLSAVFLGNLAALIPLTPTGLGIRDLVICTILQASGFSNVVALPILYTMSLLLCNILCSSAFLVKTEGHI